MAYSIWESCVFFPGFSRGECASWVQAWGSIGAILWAAYASGSSDRAQKRHALRDALAYAAFVSACIEEVEDTLTGKSDQRVAVGRAVLEAVLGGESRIRRAVLPLNCAAALAVSQSVGAQTLELARTVEAHGGVLPPPMLDHVLSELRRCAKIAREQCAILGDERPFEDGWTLHKMFRRRERGPDREQAS